MDTCYATKDLMMFIESLNKNSYCPLKDNRQVDDASGARAYQRVDALDWSDHDLATANGSRSKVFLKITKCNSSGLRCLPTARTTL